MSFKLKPILKNRKQLQKGTYKILKKMHDLERGRKFSRIYVKQINNIPSVICCLDNLIALFKQSLSNINWEDITTNTVNKEVEKLIRLKIKIEEGITNNKPIRKGTVSLVLKKHTETFNMLSFVSAEIQKPDTKLWTDVYLPVINCWKDKI